MNIRRITYYICIATTLMLASCSSEDRFVYNRLDEPLPIHSEENEESPIISSVPYDDAAYLISEGWNGWCEVEYEGVEGFIPEGGYAIVDEYGEKILITKGFIKALGIFIGVIILIGLALALIALVFAGIAYIFGILMQISIYVIVGAFLGWILGYAITKDTNSTFVCIGIGAGIGLIIGLIRTIMHPNKMSDAGLKTARDMAKHAKKKQQEREAEERRDYPLELPDGTRVRRTGYGKAVDRQGKEYDINE